MHLTWKNRIMQLKKREISLRFLGTPNISESSGPNHKNFLLKNNVKLKNIQYYIKPFNYI